MVEGLYEWPVWSAEERQEEMRLRGDVGETPSLPIESRAEEVAGKVIPEITPTKEELTSSNKNGKKAHKKTDAAPEEDLEALFAEFGVTITEKKSKTKKRK